MKALITITQFGIDMLVPIFLCSMAGRWLDGKFGTSWIFILMFFVGAAAGAGNVYRLARKLMNESDTVRNRDLAAGASGEDAASGFPDEDPTEEDEE
ncbi:MAG: AtpZ/AtpI family protein [Lachnospiraceae bacterium]|jgi:hypothetical protein|nr:AtpZ/AtpI family protein [Lachnospiraceae bacterium]